MAVPTIIGTLRRLDDTPYDGKIHFYRRSQAMFNNGPLVMLHAYTVETDATGAFETKLQPGEYEVEAAISRYANMPPSRFTVRVPNSDLEINFDDLERVTQLPSPAWFGGDPDGGGGGTVGTATVSTLGTVKLDQTDASAVVMTKKSFTATDEKLVVFRPVDGSVWVKIESTGLYHKQVAAMFGGLPQLGLQTTGVAFEDLPVA